MKKMIQALKQVSLNSIPGQRRELGDHLPLLACQIAIIFLGMRYTRANIGAFG